MAYTRKNDEAVSPVIGVILMVAITVILAAVIAAFVFGMSGNINKTKTVAATVTQPDATRIVTTYQGGQDAPNLNAMQVAVDGATSYTFTGGWMNTTVATSTTVLQVGCTTTATTTGSFSGRDHVVVTGYFNDGASQVVLDTYV